MPEAHIAAFGTALPLKLPTEQFLEIDAKIRRLHGQGEGTIDTVRQFAEGSNIRTRHVSQPFWLGDDAPASDFEDVFTRHRFDPPSHVRARAWMAIAPRLAVNAARAAVAKWGGSVADITHVVTTSTSGWSEPGISGALVENLGLSLDVQKQELNFNGCFAGMTCLRVARDLVRAGDARAVLVVAVETASLQYDPSVTEVSHLVATSLFADGAGAFILTPDKGPWRFERTGMALVPGSKDLLRMSPDLVNDRPTYRMFLDRNVGPRLAEFFRRERGRELLGALLDDVPGETPALAVHPGGPAILEALNRVFVERGWPAECLEHSLETLYNTGNLGAAALLFVLARLLVDVEQDRVATFAFGPGVTVEWGVLRRAT